mmetsp:Transcript_87082/g.182263  ORF Transcript_87082/g.182263 Transcript_87082/m.182263 type:complete len:111 (-) Transcript_87082:851-1183(-)
MVTCRPLTEASKSRSLTGGFSSPGLVEGLALQLASKGKAELIGKPSPSLDGRGLWKITGRDRRGARESSSCTEEKLRAEMKGESAEPEAEAEGLPSSSLDVVGRRAKRSK